MATESTAAPAAAAAATAALPQLGQRLRVDKDKGTLRFIGDVGGSSGKSSGWLCGPDSS